MKRILFALAGYLVWRWWSQQSVAEPQPAPPSKQNRRPPPRRKPQPDTGA